MTAAYRERDWPTALGEAEQVALAYAPLALRPAYRAVFELDAILRRIALSASEPITAQFGLAWWRDACGAIPHARGHPLLDALNACWRVDPGLLVGLVDAWEELAVAPDGFAAAAEEVARRRGAALGAAARVAAAQAVEAARAWTLVTLAERAPDAATRDAMRAAAREIAQPRLPRPLRPLTVLAGLARRASRTGRNALLGDRWSPLAAIRLGIFGR